MIKYLSQDKLKYFWLKLKEKLSTVAFSGNYADLTNKPSSLSADGGNADTVGGKTADSFATVEQGTKADNAMPKSGGAFDGSVNMPFLKVGEIDYSMSSLEYDRLTRLLNGYGEIVLTDANYNEWYEVSVSQNLHIQRPFKDAIKANRDYTDSTGVTWKAGTPLPNPFPPGRMSYAVSTIAMFSSITVDVLDLSAFTLKYILKMTSMFSQSSIGVLDLSSFDTSGITNFSNLFTDCTIDVIDLSSFDLSDAINTDLMFENCTATIGYGRTQADCDILNATTGKPPNLIFKVK